MTIITTVQREEERLTTMVTTTGEMAQGEGCHHDRMTRMTAMVTTMQDRLQERSLDKRTTTSSDHIIRLADRLLRLGSKFSDCFSHLFFIFGWGLDFVFRTNPRPEFSLSLFWLKFFVVFFSNHIPSKIFLSLPFQSPIFVFLLYYINF